MTLPFKIAISIAKQELQVLCQENSVLFSCSVSTAKKGVGQLNNSFCTPIGRHEVIAVCGINAPTDTLFKRRIPIAHGYINQVSKEDPITTRVFWLAGLDKGLNKGLEVDTKQRKIYLHGTTHINLIGAPASMGCIRLMPKDILDLERWIKVGLVVDIVL